MFHQGKSINKDFLLKKFLNMKYNNWQKDMFYNLNIIYKWMSVNLGNIPQGRWVCTLIQPSKNKEYY